MATTPPPQNGRYYTQSDPAMEKYQAAWASRRSNSYVNNPSLSEYDRIYLRGIQGTYKVTLTSGTGRVLDGFQMMLIWDYDRIWGAFDLGIYKGILMVDHGPQREPPQLWGDEDYDSADESGPDGPELPSFDFTWRGTCTEMPDTVLNNPLITKGKITFDSCEIYGHFEGMSAKEARCEFEGKPLFGPRRVGRSLQSFIDEWNEYNIFGEDETIRRPPAGATDVSMADAQEVGTASVEADEDDSSYGRSVSSRLTGAFDISSEDIEAEWPDKAQHVALRMHADLEGNKVWGWFDMGICEGFLLLDVPADELREGRPLQFTYRGREAETGTTVRGTGELEVKSPTDRQLKGFFRGMYGEAVRFSGKRKLMPTGISGRDVWYYQSGWAEYERHLNRWGR